MHSCLVPPWQTSHCGHSMLSTCNSDECVLCNSLLSQGPSEVAAQRSTSTSSITMDDSGLDGFVHMHMIDDLLTE